MKIEYKLDELASTVVEYLTHSVSDYSLLGGSLGEIFFLYYYSRIDHTYEEKADDALERLLNEISIKDGYFMSTYCNGFAGLGIALHLLEESGFIEGSDELLEDVDKLLEFSLTKEFSQKNYDFLHGAVGIGFYFLKHYKYSSEVSHTQLVRMVDYLDSTAIVDEQQNTLKWEDIGKNYDTGVVETKFNISLSHGMSSIAIFLSRLLEKKILSEKEEKRVEIMLNRTLNYILAQRLDYKIYGSYFPSSSIESDTKLYGSRLGWCYGDLGIAVALWQAGSVIHRKDCTDLSVEVLRYAASNRRDLTTNYIFDAGLCHGSAGVAQIFFRMSKELQLPELYEAYEYWRNKTLEMAYHKEGVAGYRMYNAKDFTWTNVMNVLEGVAGIGLMFLSPVCDDWDEILLLSFK